MNSVKTCFYSSKNFRLFYRQSDSGGLEISVSKKFFKLAVERNKIKRRIKEIFRGGRLCASRGIIIFSVFKPFAELSYKEAQNEIVQAVKSLKENLNEY